MDRLYQEVSQQLIDAVERYMADEISLDELAEVDAREHLVYEYKDWPWLAKNLRSFIFASTKQLYDEINELDKSIRTVDQTSGGKEYESDGLVAHSQILGRNRMPPPGLYGSSWYVGPYPTLAMVGALNDQNAESTENEEH